MGKCCKGRSRPRETYRTTIKEREKLMRKTGIEKSGEYFSCKELRTPESAFVIYMIWPGMSFIQKPLREL